MSSSRASLLAPVRRTTGIEPAPVLPDLAALAADEAHVWLAYPDSISDPSLLERYETLLSSDEREAHRRLLRDQVRHLYLVAHALVRCTLSRYADVAPEAWSFLQGQHGRPYITPGLCPAALHFNLSHTPGLVACAVSLDREVGVDVEQQSPRIDLTALADRVLSPEENRALRALPAARQLERFFELWTLKESYIKARGLGLALPLEQISFSLGDGGDIGLSLDAGVHDTPDGWQLALYHPTDSHMLAFATRQPPGRALAVAVGDTVPLAG